VSEPAAALNSEVQKKAPAVSGLSKMEAIESLVSPEISAEAEAVAPRPLLVGRGLTKVYRNGPFEVRALDDVDIDLYEGEIVVFLGESGSGKSTLLNSLGGLDVPTSGLLTYRNRDLTTASDGELTRFRRDSVGFIFQSYNLIPSLTARENVALTSEITRDPMTPEEALALVGLDDRMDFFPSQLSGGQQQRVAIARAIAKRPEVLLCDEPTGALDLRTSLTVLDTIERANQQLGTLTVIITHNAILGEMADRVIRLSNGRILTDERNYMPRPAWSLEW
jgi:putative ABC transport system ATP-binding protein